MAYYSIYSYFANNNTLRSPLFSRKPARSVVSKRGRTISFSRRAVRDKPEITPAGNQHIHPPTCMRINSLEQTWVRRSACALKRYCFTHKYYLFTHRRTAPAALCVSFVAHHFALHHHHNIHSRFPVLHSFRLSPPWFNKRFFGLDTFTINRSRCMHDDAISMRCVVNSWFMRHRYSGGVVDVCILYNVQGPTIVVTACFGRIITWWCRN